MARGPEAVPGREAASVSRRQPRVDGESTADETGASDSVRSRESANVAGIASAQQPTGGGHAERATGNIDLPAVSPNRRDSGSGDAVDDA
ncbi:hypothetical protein, partial [Desulfococcus sp.]|uniref:hypothetical protein n=1 Tax=Desulfococcus sp. TaxID=2025834 RepID=UPI003593A6A0